MCHQGRLVLRLFASVVFVSFVFSHAPGASFESAWPETAERVWIGPEFWANRLQDWRLSKGRLECVTGSPRLGMRTVHLLTHGLSPKEGEFQARVRLGLIDQAKTTEYAAAGLLVGVGPDMDYRSAAIVHQAPGGGGGWFVGIDGSGRVFVLDNTAKGEPGPRATRAQSGDASAVRNVELRIAATPHDTTYSLTVSAHDPKNGKELSTLTREEIPQARLAGNVALVSHAGGPKANSRFWFRDLRLSGPKVASRKNAGVGPVLSTQYTLSGNVLKMTAQMMPVGKSDTEIVRLQVPEGKRWLTVAQSRIVVPGWTATFRVPEWDFTRDTRYRVAYHLKAAGGEIREHHWYGTVRKNPLDRETIVVAGFTGNHNCAGGFGRPGYAFARNIWFPHADLTAKVVKHNPDLLFFSGDQVYEGGSPTSAVRGQVLPTMMDYLYKWYLWCWAYRDLNKDIPCIVIPDDHDVYQGNLWGQGGRKSPGRDHHGGYVEDAEFVKMVERTQTSHLPDPHDPTPIEQGIGVYYTAMSWGRVGFAVLEDRKFKSGCARPDMPPSRTGRPDHFNDPKFDVRKLDIPGVQLLGERQLRFLRDWAADWRGQDMKCALSQTVFAGLATHHGGRLARLRADLDSNGWPQTGRNKALHELRRGFVFHIGGDQHLATVAHHGIDDWKDAGWSFAVPSVANFYLRAWAPKQPGRYEFPKVEDYTGPFLDGLGNRVTVYAATNPGKSMGHEPANLHDKMPGYGIVRFNKEKRTITIECWPRFADPADPEAKQYEGWPLTIRQEDNYGRKAVAYLPAVEVQGLTNPVVQVTDEESGDVVYTLRIRGDRFQPSVFKEGRYTVKAGDPDTERWQTKRGVPSASKDAQARLRFVFPQRRGGAASF